MVGGCISRNSDAHGAFACDTDTSNSKRLKFHFPPNLEAQVAQAMPGCQRDRGRLPARRGLIWAY